MDGILNKINNLSAKGFTDEDCRTFASELSIVALVKFYLASEELAPTDESKVENALEIILKQSDIFSDLFFNPDNKDQAVEILTTNDDTILTIVTGALYFHRDLILKVISAKLSNAESIDHYLDVLFYLFTNESVAAYSSVSRLFAYLASSSAGEKLFGQESFLKHLAEGLSSDFAIVKARTFELIIELSRLENLQLILAERCLVSKACGLYLSLKEDILEKLNYLELLKRFTYSKYALDSMKALGLIDCFKAEAFNEETDLYIRRDVLVILSQLYKNNLIEYDDKAISEIYRIVAEWLSSPKEARNAGFEVGLVFFNCEENLFRLLSDSALMSVLVSTNNMKEHHLVKSLEFRVSLATESKSNLHTKQVKPVSEHEFKRMLIAFYHPCHFNKSGENLDDTMAATEALLNACQIPFDDIELCHLSVFEKLMEFESLTSKLSEVQNIESFLLSLKFKGAKGESVLYRKSELLRKLRDRLIALHGKKPETQQRIGWMIDIINSKGPSLEFNVANESAT
jgi:hypothetical protein